MTQDGLGTGPTSKCERLLCFYGNLADTANSRPQERNSPGPPEMAVPTQPTEGMYYDELSKVRVIEPDTAGKTQGLKDECKDFVDGKHDYSLHPLFLSFFDQ